MINGIIGIKGEMGQVFVDGKRIPVTKITAGPCVVTQVKSAEKDGYGAIQLGLGEKKAKRVKKPMLGHFKPLDKHYPKYLREVRLDSDSELKVGDTISVGDVFSEGDSVSVTGISKGRGFAGVVKRWGFSGGPKTHGQSDRQRAPGSIGQGTDPGRVRKGKKMAGRMGTQRFTVKGLLVIGVDKDTNELLVKGPVPGNSGGLLIIKVKDKSGGKNENGGENEEN